MGKSGENDPGSVPPSSRSRDTQIFLCDASAEAGRLLSGLIARGYAAVDVPLGLLPNRVNYEIPVVVVIDADAREARSVLEEMLEIAGEHIEVALLADPKGAIAEDPALRKLSSLVIPRPVDLDTAVDKIATLTGTPSKGSHRPRIGVPRRSPILVASARKPYRSDGEPSPKLASSHPPRARADVEEDSLWPLDSPPSRGPLGAEGGRTATETSFGQRNSTSSAPPSSGRLTLSPETRSVLEEGKRRVATYPTQNSPRPIRLSPQAHDQGEEVRPEFLEALAEVLGDIDPGEKSEDSSEETSGGTVAKDRQVRAGASRRPSEPTGATSIAGIVRPDFSSIELDEEEETTNPGGRAPSQPPPTSPQGSESIVPSDVPPGLDDLSDLLSTRSSIAPPSSSSVPTERPGSPLARFADDTPHLSVTVPPPRRGLHRPEDLLKSRSDVDLEEHPTSPSVPASLAQGRGETAERSKRETDKAPFENTWRPTSALYLLARAIQGRKSGAVAQQEGAGLRRIVLTDGDISTVTSTLRSESLAHFLASRGDITNEVLQSLGGLPGFGRHAGAALIARGVLQQEDLWPVLRAHSEWILGRALLSEEEALREETVPARILEEPAVFGGAAGTEIYLETMRRVVSPEQASSLLGPQETVIGMGRHESLLGESALDQSEQQFILDSVGKPLSRIKESHPELLPVVLGLTYLGVLSIGGQAPEPASAKNEELLRRNDEIDDEAFVARVITRRALIDDGDYFSILGVSRSATGYEIDRARDDLLVEYSEHRLTARTVHLQEDLRLLRQTIDEAHLVLRDDVRRMRYRAALEAMPD